MRTVYWNRVGRVVAGMVAFCGAAVIAAECYEPGALGQCCASQNIPCSGDGVWVCSSTTDAGPFTISTVKLADNGHTGFEDVVVTTAGTCNRTPVTCGSFNGECLPGTPVATTCNNQGPGVIECTGGGDPE